jgi:hypothetical protein
MELKIRHTRTLKVTEVNPSREEQAQLAQLWGDPRYNALLNLMERTCIEIDSGLINAPVNDPEGVLGAQCVSKAAWIFFTYLQKKVLNAYQNREVDTEEAPQPQFEELIQGVGWNGDDFSER